MALSVMFLVVLGGALHATWNGLVKGGSDRHLDLAALLTAAALLTLGWLPFLPLPARACWPYLAVSTCLHQVYFALIVLSYHKGDMSLVYPVTRGTAPALTALSSVLLLREPLSLAGSIGVGFVSSGVLLLAFQSRDAAKVQTVPLLLALANAGMIVLYTLVDGMGVRLSGHAFSYTSWGFLLCGLLFTPMALLLRRGETVRHLKKEWRNSLIGAACSIASYSLALWAMTRAPIAMVAALRETSIIFGLLIAAFTLRERITPLRIAAVAMAAAGAVILKLG